MELESLKTPIWVSRETDLRAMVTQLEKYPIISVDTESNSLHAYQEQVCLVQFSTPDEDYLVDPLALAELSELAPLFSNPGIVKIFHAAEYDLICLRRDFDFTFFNLFDTMLAARILGKSAVGLGSLLESEFGVILDKHYQRADWAQRPLPPALRAYARLDTHYLLPLRSRLLEELEKTGRLALAEEDFRRMAHGIPTTNGGNGSTLEAFWRIPGAQDLSPQQAAMLRELANYRDQQARAANLPPFKVFNNQALLAIVQATPRTLNELGDVGALSARQLQRHGAALLRALERGLQAPPQHRPSMPRKDEHFINRLDALRNWRKQAAKTMGVESDVILPRDLLYSLAEHDPESAADLSQILSDTPWRLENFGGKILEILKKAR